MPRKTRYAASLDFTSDATPAHLFARLCARFGEWRPLTPMSLAILAHLRNSQKSMLTPEPNTPAKHHGVSDVAKTQRGGLLVPPLYGGNVGRIIQLFWSGAFQ